MEYNKKETLDFRSIVLRHIERILELSSSELRNKTTKVFKPNQQLYEFNEDTRISYVQSVENLAYVLYPYFDEETLTIYNDSIKVIISLEYEIIKMFEKEIEEIKKETGENKIGSNLITLLKLKSAKKLFLQLNILLNKNGYLKSTIYGESVEDEAIEDDD